MLLRHVAGKHNSGGDDGSCERATACFVDPGDYPVTGSSAFRLERESRACFPFLRRLHDAFRIRYSRSWFDLKWRKGYAATARAVSVEASVSGDSSSMKPPPRTRSPS